MAGLAHAPARHPAAAGQHPADRAHRQYPALGQESGLIAVTMMGLVMANMKGLDVEDLLSFKEYLTVVQISMLFILLAARVDLEQVASIGIASLLVLAVALFVARPLFGSGVTWSKLASLAGKGAVNLFALDERSRLCVFTPGDDLAPEPGWTVVNLGMENDDK